MASDPFAPQHKRAARELRRIYRACKEQGGATSWAIVRDQLNLTTGIRINRGTLSGVARGKRPATPQIFRALGMPVPHYKPAPACPECGKVHYRSLRSCPDNKKPRKPGKRWKEALYIAARERVASLTPQPPLPEHVVDTIITGWLELANREAGANGESRNASH